MTPPTTLVPSKNALRALRHLALSTPSILLGTVGSICGVAALHHETCRRVRVAEKIVETKRVLRSVSSGRGPAHLSALFEAAERGEDFTLRSKGPRKRRRKDGSRSLSTAAVPHTSDDSYESRPHDDVQPGKSQAAHRRSGSGLDVGSDTVNTTADIPIQRVSTVTFRKVVVGSKGESKPPLHHVDRSSISQNQPMAEKIPGCVQRWLTQGTTESGKETESVGSSPASNGVSRARADRHGRNQVDGVSTRKSQGNEHRLQWTPLLYVSGAGADPELLPPKGNDYLAEASHFDLRKYLSETKSKLLEEQSTGFAIPHQLVICDSDESMEQALRAHLEAAKGTRLPSPSPIQEVNFATRAADPDTLSLLMDFIHPTTRQLSKPARFRRWTAVMRYYIRQGQPSDWVIAEAVFHTGRSLFNATDVLSRPLFDLLRHLLSTEANVERARDILFPSQTLDPENSVVEQNSKGNGADLAVKYLTWFCEHTRDYSTCLEEMTKVVDIARRSGSGPSEKFAMPVLQTMVRAGDMEAARSMLDQLDSTYELHHIQRLWGEYAVWNAASGNWGEAQWVLDQMQETGYSRHQPEQYAAMFHRILLHYLSKNPAHRSFGFAVNAIKYTGLIPTARISRTIVCACIREHRYDLVFEWTRLVSEAFPRLTSGFMTPSGAWQLAHALQSASASCRDIADTCRAIAHGCYDDPFPHYLRPLLADLVKLDLSHRLDAASAVPSDVLLSCNGTPLMTMDQLLAEARRFCASTTTSGKAAPIDDRKHDIAIQLSAVEELTRVLRGDVFMPDLPDLMESEGPEPVPTRRTQTSDAQQSTINSAFPDVFRQDKLPGYTELSVAAIDYYATREKQGFSADHSLLKYLIDKVALDSPVDALNLIEQIHESEYVQGIHGMPFDNEIFVRWLQVVATVGSVKAASTVLWAVVDSSRHLTWTLDFSFCLNIVTYICIGSVKGKKGALLTPEMFYLGRRLWWTRQRSPGHVEDDFEFPKWRPWELALRDAASRPMERD